MRVTTDLEKTKQNKWLARGTAFTRNGCMTHASATESEIIASPVGLAEKVVFTAPEGKSQIGTIMMSKAIVSVLRTV
jgi:hypothetical protein